LKYVRSKYYESDDIMKKIAVLFGNDTYDFGKAQLQCAVNDAKALEKNLLICHLKQRVY